MATTIQLEQQPSRNRFNVLKWAGNGINAAGNKISDTLDLVIPERKFTYEAPYKGA
jgi:hypothetical protein